MRNHKLFLILVMLFAIPLVGNAMNTKNRRISENFEDLDCILRLLPRTPDADSTHRLIIQFRMVGGHFSYSQASLSITNQKNLKNRVNNTVIDTSANHPYFNPVRLVYSDTVSVSLPNSPVHLLKINWSRNDSNLVRVILPKQIVSITKDNSGNCSFTAEPRNPNPAELLEILFYEGIFPTFGIEP